MLEWLKTTDGWKTYLAAILGIIIILVSKFIVDIPGVALDPDNWLTDIWGCILLMTGRSALAKLEATAP